MHAAGFAISAAAFGTARAADSVLNTAGSTGVRRPRVADAGTSS